MARKPRIDYPGARHHVMNRGPSHNNIFHKDSECEFFLSLVAEAVDRFGIRIPAFVLMPNHYHLLVESVHGNLSHAMKLIGQEFTQGKNRPRGKDGATFRGRFASKLVTNGAHWFHLPFYLHLNPVKARLVLKPSQWDWSSRECFARKDGKGSFPFLDNTEELISYGQTSGYRSLEREIVTGKRLEPVEFDSALFSKRTRSPDVVIPNEQLGAKDPRNAIEEVTALTGCTQRSLKITTMGPGGNLPRALAVWWLAYGYQVTNVEIAELLKMSDTAVAKTLARFKGKGPRYQSDQLWEWVNTLKSSGK